MRKIDLDNAMLIYDEGELVAAYEVKKTKADITKALKDYGYFDDYDDDDWEMGVGENECHSLEDVAKAIVEDGSFFEDSGARFFTVNGSFPRER